MHGPYGSQGNQALLVLFDLFGNSMLGIIYTYMPFPVTVDDGTHRFLHDILPHARPNPTAARRGWAPLRSLDTYCFLFDFF